MVMSSECSVDQDDLASILDMLPIDKSRTGFSALVSLELDTCFVVHYAQLERAYC